MTAFDVLMVSINWRAPDEVESIISSKRILKPASSKGRFTEYDTVLYHKEEDNYFQIAVRSKLQPFLRADDGTWKLSRKLYQVSDDIWIIKQEWRTGQRGKGFHYCPSINTPGKIYIGLSEDLKNLNYEICIDVNSNIEDFDFDRLKDDFEGELWSLVTSNKSPVKTDRLELRYSDKIFRYPESKTIIDFLRSVDAIIKNPKQELTYTKEIRSQKVIPIAETYRKLSVSGVSKTLPSKAVSESVDVYENRVAGLMLNNVHLILTKNLSVAGIQSERLTKEIIILNNRIKLLENPDPKVDPAEIEAEIKRQEEFYIENKKRWKINVGTFLATQGKNSQYYRQVRAEIVYRYNSNAYWVNIYGPNGEKEYCLIEFDNDVDGIFEEQKNMIVNLSAHFFKSGIAGRAGYPKYTFQEVSGIELISTNYEKIIHKQKRNLEILRSNNWSQFSILSAADKRKFQQERNNQIQTLKNKILKIQEQISSLSDFASEQKDLIPLCKQRIKHPFFKTIKWRSIAGFKPSMTFIQNIHYRNCLRYYKDILTSEGIDIEIFDLYEKVTEYGLKEMPLVYELWCLVSLIKVLEESYRFKHVRSDITNLLKSVSADQRAEKHSVINFTKNLAGRTIKIHYQKSDRANKRPDIILEVAGKKKTINLVLDSKFKNYNYKKSIIHECLSMEEKYGGSNSFVFILHPCKDGLYENKKVKYTNHGGERIFIDRNEGNEIIFPFHEYGYIELKPGSTDSLKKLVGMGFEYLLEPNRNAKQNNVLDPLPEQDMFCLSCGGSDIEIVPTNRRNNSKFYTCTCKDKSCGHSIYIDYCWNCKTKLFKHGSYWDYHLESTWSIFDIRCPQCGMTVADRPQSNEF